MMSESDWPDDYSHDDTSIFYTPTNIPGPGCDADLLSASLSGCECQGLCAEDLCHCRRWSPGHYRHGKFEENTDHPIFECHEKCPCAEDCAHRLVQRGPIRGLTVGSAGGKGRGLFTSVAIELGTFVCEYAGEMIGSEEARRRFFRQTSAATMNYIIVVNEFSQDGQRCQQTIVDPEYFGNIGRYANHSCDANLIMMPVRIGEMVPHLALFARRDIMAGEELTFDYEGLSNREERDKVEMSPGELSFCRCGAKMCRKYLPCNSFDKLNIKKL